jgi:hypothetical protein
MALTEAEKEKIIEEETFRNNLQEKYDDIYMEYEIGPYKQDAPSDGMGFCGISFTLFALTSIVYYFIG